MNDSTSTISPAWPTRWPKNSFRSPWTWVLAIVIALIFIFLFIASVRAASSGVSIAHVSPMIVLLSLFITAALEAILILAVLLSLPGLSKFSLTDLGFRVPTKQAVLIGIAGAVAMIVVANGGATLIDYFAHSKHEQGVIELFKGLRDPATMIIFGLFACVFAPFAEETIFRVFFFNLGLRYGGFWTGAVISGVLFGLAHNDLYALVPLALGGMILCYVYYRSRNAFASMISHGLFNLASILALVFTPNLTK